MSERAENTFRSELEMTTPSEHGKPPNMKSANSRVVPMSGDSLHTESNFSENNPIKIVNESLKETNDREEIQKVRQVSEPNQEG